VSTTKAFDVEKAREVVTGAGFPRAVVQESGEGNLTVRDADLSNDDVAALITKLKPVLGDSELVRDELIGPSLGKELRLKAVIALVVALLAQLIYLAVRFRWTFGLAAVVAMLHDVVFVIGAFAWMGKTLDGVFLAAALTVIGVSVNDSIVTLDRIRETWSARRREPLEKAANQAVLDTAPRTVNTGLGAMFILAALTVLGGDTLTDFSLAVLIGLVVGTWSSAFTATPLLLVFQRWSSAPPPAAKSVRSTSTQRKKRTSWEPEGGAVI
jgi:SecD/SecF fusion protein